MAKDTIIVISILSFIVAASILYGVFLHNPDGGDKNKKPDTELTNSELRHYSFKPKAAESFTLATPLKEISGLTFSEKNRLYANNDEQGVIFEINPVDGSILRTIELASFTGENDFEGIAAANGYLYIVNSSGQIYGIREDVNGTSAPFQSFPTPLNQKYDIEGLCFHPASNSLLLACKEFSGKGLSDYKTVYAYDLQKKELLPEPFLKISIEEMKKKGGSKNFAISAIEYSKFTNTFFLLGGKSFELMEVSPKGEVLGIISLSSKVHRQPEGLTFLEGRTLLISDEAAGKTPTMTKYKRGK